jgi:hypothetical protein
MSALAALKLVVGKKNRAVSPVMLKREKLRNKLAEQIALCEAQQGGEICAPKRLKTVVDAETGERKVISTTKRVREWYWRTSDGKVNLAIKYGAKTLSLGKGGKNAIELANENEVLDALRLIKNAVSLGELDDAIAEASTATRTAFGK